MDFQVGDIVTAKPEVWASSIKDKEFMAEIVRLEPERDLADIRVITVSTEIQNRYDYFVGQVGQVISAAISVLVPLERDLEAMPTTHYCSRCTYTEVSCATEICKWCW